MKDTNEITIARSNDFKKNLYHHVGTMVIKFGYQDW